VTLFLHQNFPAEARVHYFNGPSSIEINSIYFRCDAKTSSFSVFCAKFTTLSKIVDTFQTGNGDRGDITDLEIGVETILEHELSVFELFVTTSSSLSESLTVTM